MTISRGGADRGTRPILRACMRARYKPRAQRVKFCRANDSQSPAWTARGSLPFKRHPLPRNENRARRMDIILSAVVALVDGDAHPTPRIDVQQRVAYRRVHKRPDVGHAHHLLVDVHGHLVPKVIAQLLELLPG